MKGALKLQSQNKQFPTRAAHPSWDS